MIQQVEGSLEMLVSLTLTRVRLTLLAVGREWERVTPKLSPEGRPGSARLRPAETWPGQGLAKEQPLSW